MAKHSWEASFFEKIDNPTKAYWLGFLYADGSVRDTKQYSTFKLQLQRRDKSYLQKLKEDLQATHPIWDTFSKGGHFIRGKQMKDAFPSCFQVYSKKACKDLILLGCFPRKSLILQFPTLEQVPNSLISHFIRGYFDGNGSIGFYIYKGYCRKHYHISFCGTEHFLKAPHNQNNL